jgi:ferrous iron transport protein A
LFHPGVHKGWRSATRAARVLLESHYHEDRSTPVSPRAESRLAEWQESSEPRVESAEPVARAQTALASLAPGESASVVSVALERELVRWLEAIGIGAGDRVTVLRRAAFGGPIHLRTQAGGEFAVDRALAASIACRRNAAGDAVA